MCVVKISQIFVFQKRAKPPPYNLADCGIIPDEYGSLATIFSFPEVKREFNLFFQTSLTLNQVLLSSLIG
jgi:hypothetical protein